MRIVALTGDSGTGKTTLMQRLCNYAPTLYHPVMSYTDRPMREENEYGHTFISSEEMQDTLKSAAVVAETQIGDFFYCATEEQFSKDKINLYIVDRVGLAELKYYFPKDNIFTILFLNKSWEISKDRELREIDIPDTADLVIRKKLLNEKDIIFVSKKIEGFDGF